MIEILHYLKDPKLWELWYLPHYGKCRIFASSTVGLRHEVERLEPSGFRFSGGGGDVEETIG